MTRSKLADARTRWRTSWRRERPQLPRRGTGPSRITVAYTDLYRAEPADRVHHRLDAAASAGGRGRPGHARPRPGAAAGGAPDHGGAARRVRGRRRLHPHRPRRRRHSRPRSRHPLAWGLRPVFGGFACAALDQAELAHRYAREGLEQSPWRSGSSTSPTSPRSPTPTPWASARLGDDPVAAAARITAAVDALVAAGHLRAGAAVTACSWPRCTRSPAMWTPPGRRSRTAARCPPGSPRRLPPPVGAGPGGHRGSRG